MQLITFFFCRHSGQIIKVGYTKPKSARIARLERSTWKLEVVGSIPQTEVPCEGAIHRAS